MQKLLAKFIFAPSHAVGGFMFRSASRRACTVTNCNVGRRTYITSVLYSKSRRAPRRSCRRQSLWSSPWSSLAVARRSSAMRTAAESHPWGSTSTTTVSWSRCVRWTRRGRKGTMGFIAASVVLRHCFGCCSSHHFRLHQSNRRVVGQGVRFAEVNEDEPRSISHQSRFAMPSLAEGCIEVALEQLAAGPPYAPGKSIRLITWEWV